jgi:hypothetical protein
MTTTSLIPPVRPPEPLPPEEMQRAIAQLKSMQGKNAGIDDLKAALQPIFTGWQITAPVFDPGMKLYRGRVLSGDVWDNLADLSYPPSDIAKAGRANREAQPLFYCSVAREPVFFETHVSVGDKLAVVHYETVTPLALMSLGYTAAVAEASRSSRPVPEYGQLGHTDARESDLLVNKFLSDLFTSEHPERDYLMSIAVAEKMLDAEMMDGLLYPSLAMSANADNIALKPRFADQHLRAIYAECLEITAVKGKRISVKGLDEARHISDGKIEWLGHVGNWQLTKHGQQLLFEAVDGHWIARDEDGNIVDPA